MNLLLKLYEQNDVLQQQYQEFTKEANLQKVSVQNQYREKLIQEEIEYNNKYLELFERAKVGADKLASNQEKYDEVYRQNDDVFIYLFIYFIFVKKKNNKQEHYQFLQQVKILLQQEKQEEIKKQEELRTSNSKKNNEIDRFNQRRLELESILKEACTQIDHLDEERINFNEKNVLMQVRKSILKKKIKKKKKSYNYKAKKK